MRTTHFLYGACLSAGFFFTPFLDAQEPEKEKLDLGEIHGNFEVTGQYYNEDTLIGAPDVPEDVGLNTFLNLIYRRGKVEAGGRFEAYAPPLQGFDPGYEGSGIIYRYLSYNAEDLSVTVGNFYEQFGNGLVYRTYEERSLGIDNAMEGVRVKYNPFKGVYLKGVWGKQRLLWSNQGLVRGVDGEFAINEMKESFDSWKTRFILGGSFVSKYQQDQDPIFDMPENVGAYAGRFSIINQKITINGEYVYKINDPSADNWNVFRDGQAAFLSASYSIKGFGITLAGKHIDNMSFRSDRAERVNNLMVNYLPALTRQHTYNLAATLYPYATQPTGEVGYQAELIYKVPRKTKLGGKYGTTIQINYGAANGLDTTKYYNYTASDTDPHPHDPDREGYTTNLFGGGDVYFKDFNVEVTRKLNKKLKIKAMYMNLVFNNDIVNVTKGDKGTFYADIGVLDVLWKVKPKHAIRTELQHMWIASNKDQGNWVTALSEYTFSPHWFVAVIDQYNYGNEVHEKRIHYVTGTLGYNNKGNRISIGYGRQRAGVFCVGGVCRNVPASNGVTLSITSSF